MPAPASLDRPARRRGAARSKGIDGLDVYLDQIQADALLSADEERELAERVASGDEAARARMIRANLRLVVKVAREFTGRGVGLEDLIGEGNAGLIKAVDRFDPAVGVRFSTYGCQWIRQAIRQAFRDTAATIRVPAYMVALMGKWRRAERLLRRELGRDPSFDEVANRLNLTAEQRDGVARAQRAGRVRHEGASDEEGDWSADEVSDERGGPDVAPEQSDDRRDLLRRLAQLDDRERTVIAMRFGLDDGEPLGFRAIGDHLGLSREWVRRIQDRALGKLA